MKPLIFLFATIKAFAEPNLFVQASPELETLAIRHSKGTLSFKTGKELQTISIGAKAGSFAFGLIFETTELPESYRKEFPGKEIIQIVLANDPTNQNQINRFGTLSLFPKTMVVRKTFFNFAMPVPKTKTSKQYGWLLFQSPKAEMKADEDRLKQTIYGSSGHVALVPKGKTHQRKVLYEGETSLFAMQLFELVLDAELITPFTEQKNSLRGTIELPILRPISQKAKAVLTQSLSVSLMGLRKLAEAPRAKQ